MATIGVTRLTIKPHALITTILTFLILLLIITVIIRNGEKDSLKILKRKGRNLKRAGEFGEKALNLKIDPRILKIPDTRSLYCKQLVYDFNQPPETMAKSQETPQKNKQPQKSLKSLKRVSIILSFSDYQFYEMKKTLESVLVSDGMELVREVLVVDDATSLDYIIHHSTTYLSKIPIVKLLRTNSNEPLGVAKTRNLAATEAEGEFLVFLGHSCVVSKGWLQPLIHWLHHNPLTIACPHFDLVRDPVSMFYTTLPDNITFTLTLTLTIRPFQVSTSLINHTLETNHKRGHFDSDYNNNHNNKDLNNNHIDHSHTAIYDSAALRGDVVAVERSFFLETLKGYDEALQEFGGGEHVDLSLKAWLCGGGVKMIMCSRVGVVNALDPIKTRSNYNVKLLVKKWFSGSGFTSSIYRLASKEKISDYGGADSDDKEKKASQDHALSTATKPPHCKVPVKRYINEVAVTMVRLRDDSVAYGLLKAGTNRCAHLIRTASLTKLKMDLCERLVLRDPRGGRELMGGEDSDHEKETIFQLSRGGQLRVGEDGCVGARDNAYLSVEGCREGDDRQLFTYKGGLLVNTWSGYCVMQVTDPDPSIGHDRQIAMVQACDSYSEKDKDFMMWIFVNL